MFCSGNARGVKREGRGKANWGTAQDELQGRLDRQESVAEIVSLNNDNFLLR